jgi:hypothetical protein
LRVATTAGTPVEPPSVLGRRATNPGEPPEPVVVEVVIVVGASAHAEELRERLIVEGAVLATSNA